MMIQNEEVDEKHIADESNTRSRAVVSPKLFGFSKKFAEGLEGVTGAPKISKEPNPRRSFLINNGGDNFKPIKSVDPTAAEMSRPSLHLSGKMVDLHNIAQKGQHQRAYMQQLQEMTSTKFFQIINNTHKTQTTPLNLQKLLEIQQRQLSQSQQDWMEPKAEASKPSSPRAKTPTTIRIPSPGDAILPPIMADDFSMLSFQDSIVSETDSLLIDQLRSQAEQVFSIHLSTEHSPRRTLLQQQPAEHNNITATSLTVPIDASLSNDNYSIMTPYLEVVPPTEQVLFTDTRPTAITTRVDTNTTQEQEDEQQIQPRTYEGSVSPTTFPFSTMSLSPFASPFASPRNPSNHSPANYLQNNNYCNHHQKYDEFSTTTTATVPTPSSLTSTSPAKPKQPWRSYSKPVYRKQNYINKRSPAAVAAYYEKIRISDDADWKEKALKFLLQDNDDELNTQDLIQRELMEEMHISFDKETNTIEEERYHFEKRLPMYVNHIAEPMTMEGNDQYDVVHAMTRGKLKGAVNGPTGGNVTATAATTSISSSETVEKLTHIHELLVATTQRKHGPEPQVLESVPEILDGPMHYSITRTAYIPPTIAQEDAALRMQQQQQQEEHNEGTTTLSIQQQGMDMAQTVNPGTAKEEELRTTIPASSSTALLLQEAEDYLKQRLDEKKRGPDWYVYYEPLHRVTDTTLASLISFNYHQTMKELPGFANYASGSSSTSTKKTNRSPSFYGLYNTGNSRKESSLASSSQSMKAPKHMSSSKKGSHALSHSLDNQEEEDDSFIEDHQQNEEDEFRMYLPNSPRQSSHTTTKPHQPQNQSLSTSAFASPRRKKHLVRS